MYILCWGILYVRFAKFLKLWRLKKRHIVALGVKITQCKWSLEGGEIAVWKPRWIVILWPLFAEEMKLDASIGTARGYFGQLVYILLG
jgi:hypothetical protein